MTYERAFAVAKEKTENGVPSIPRRHAKRPGGWDVERVPAVVALLGRHGNQPRGEAWRACRSPERSWLYGRDRRNVMPRPDCIKLTEESVTEIRALYKAGDVTQQELADCYNVAPTTINHVIRRRTWRDVA